MSENNQGKVVPFALTATRMRRRAEEHARRGRTLEAIELYRRAAQEDEMPTGWLYLARLLRSCACYEQAMSVLYRMIARPDVPPDAFLELAKCQKALDMREGMQDSLYHLLEEDPYSDSADEGRGMLADDEAEHVSKEPFRLPLVRLRATQAWYRGNRALAVRRFRRTAKMSSHPGHEYATLAMLSLTSPKPQTALCYAAKAMRLEPDNVNVRLMAAVCFALQGKRRFACALLQKCLQEISSVAEEKAMLTTLETVRLPALKKQCLSALLKRTPHRAELLRQLANDAAKAGELKRAEAIWHTMLRIDPADYGTLMLLRTAQREPESFEAGTYQKRADIRMEGRLTEVIIRKPEDEQLAPGSETRAAIDWCMAQGRHLFRKPVLQSIADADTAKAQEYLKDLLTNPGTNSETRRVVMELLADRGMLDQLPVLVNQRLALAQAAQSRNVPHAMEKRFLTLVMLETRKHHMTSAMVHFAASVWSCMSRRMRENAVGKSSYAYVKAVEIIRLRMAGLDDAAREAAGDVNVSFRRIERVIERLIAVGAVEIAEEGDWDDEMYQF